VRIVEVVIAGVLALAALRSLWTWSRRTFEGTDVIDHVLFALFVTGRVGLWLSLAGFFVISASIDVRGRAAMDELETYRWYLIVPIVLAAVQLLAGWFLGRREAG
jgi:hypothetical protein